MPRHDGIGDVSGSSLPEMVKRMLSLGASPEDVSSILCGRGLPESDIAEAILTVQNLRFLAPLGTGELMPAIVIGYEIQGISGVDVSAAWSTLINLTTPLRFLVHVEQQAGGVCMRHPEVLGVVLPWELNKDKAITEPSHLTRGIRAMGESSDDELLEKEYPELANLWLTRGKDYSAAQLQELSQALAAVFRLPSLESGLEAFVRFEMCNLMEFFDGWSWAEIPVSEGRSCDWLAASDHGWREAAGVFDLSLLACLRAFALEHLFTELGQCPTKSELLEPRAFLLWENCD